MGENPCRSFIWWRACIQNIERTNPYNSIIKTNLGLPWRFSGWNSWVPTAGVWVQSLGGELGKYMPHSTLEKKNCNSQDNTLYKRAKFCLTYISWWTGRKKSACCSCWHPGCWLWASWNYDMNSWCVFNAPACFPFDETSVGRTWQTEKSSFCTIWNNSLWPSLIGRLIKPLPY